MERFLFLEGLPNLQDLERIMIGEDLEEMLDCELKQEMIAVPLLREAISFCESQNDYISRDLLNKILSNEEEHIDWLETQMKLIADAGLQNFLQSQM